MLSRGKAVICREEAIKHGTLGSGCDCVSCSGLWCTVEVEGGTDFYRTTGTEEINTGGVEELVECY